MREEKKTIQWEDIARNSAKDAIRSILNMPEVAMLIEEEIFKALAYARKEAQDEMIEGELNQRISKYNQAKEDGTLDKHFPKL